MGRSRGGLTTKIYALVDANGLPVTLKLTEGQAHDGRSAADVLDSLAVATRFEKHDANYLVLVKLAAARIWMRFMSR